MPRTYERKFLKDGTLNPKFKPDSRSRDRGEYQKQYREKNLEKLTTYDKEYREKNKTELAEYRKNYEKKYVHNQFLDSQFIAIDGEGGEYDDRHVYTLLMLSSGESIHKKSGLSSDSIFEFLLSTFEKQPKNSIYVVYGGSYDANMWIRDLPLDIVQDIVKNEGMFYTRYKSYDIRYMPRKYFAIRRAGAKQSYVVWDVIGFFQNSFVGTLKQWLPGDQRTDLIIKGKAGRSQFDESQIEFIKEYCQAELDTLVLVMNKLREAVSNLGLTLRRWDGAGAVAAAFFKKYDVKSAICELPELVQHAAQHAFFGGRIEIGKYGHCDKTVHHYDINSAYPSIHTNLPNLANGRWEYRGKDFDPRTSPNSMIISRVFWNIHDDNVRFAPFPFRCDLQNLIIFPTRGENWVWKPEVAAALDAIDEYNLKLWQVQVVESWEFIPNNPFEKPFSWIEDNFEERKKLVAESKKTGVPNGMEKVIKLGLNSAYGKTAQKAGYKGQHSTPEEIAKMEAQNMRRAPPFHQLAYAGMITSGARAMLWSAAMQAPENIICLATDGIYSEVPLKLDCPSDKILGKWEYQKHDNMTLVQAGFYWFDEGDYTYSFSRGFDKMNTQEEVKRTRQEILNAWKNKEMDVHLPCTRFITMKTALVSEKWYGRWCSWYKMRDENRGKDGRRLFLGFSTGKRRNKSDAYGTPHKKMIDTLPTANINENISGKYHIPWRDANEDLSNAEVLDEHIDAIIDGFVGK